jgi:hypothetical protein
MDSARREELGREMLALQEKLKSKGEAREAVVDETSSAAPLQ